MISSSPLSALSRANKKTIIRYDFLLVVIGVIIPILTSSIFTVLASNQSAFATFPGENGKIAFSSLRDGNYEIYVMNADGSEQINISQDRFDDIDPDWSADGTKIAFASTRPGNYLNWGIWVMNADGSEPTMLVDTETNERHPSWSPDGTKIAYENQGRIFVMNADGTGQRQISTNPFGDDNPDWSPDGTKIAFSKAQEIFVMNADGSGETRLTFTTATEASPSWSPDGTKIAFTSGRDGNSEIYVMNADGMGQTRLTNTLNQEGGPDWSPDGTKITFVIGDDIYVMDADDDGSGRINLVNNPAHDDFPDWGPATDTEPEDTTLPVITVQEDMTVEASGPDGATVSFEVSAEDDVDGPVDVSCDYDSGDTFPIGETVVTCSAEDAAGNRAEESFTITVQDTTRPDVEITEAVDRSDREITDGSGRTPIPYIEITFEATDAVGIDETECSLDGQAFTPCTSPVSYDRLSRTTHEVTVRATDEAGNTGEDEFSWTVGAPPSNTGGGRNR